MNLCTIVEAKFAKPEFVYHGTTGDRARSIIKLGMQANPKQRVWDKDDDAGANTASRKSLSGSYWAANLGTALSSATTALMRKYSGTEIDWRTKSGLLIIAQVIEASALADEDDVGGRGRWAYANMMKEVLNCNPDAISAIMRVWYSHDPQWKMKLVNAFAREMHAKESELMPVPLGLAREFIQAEIDRQYAHAMNGAKNDWYSPARDIPEEDRPVPMPVAQAEDELLAVKDKFTRYYKNSAIRPDPSKSYSHTFRVDRDIGFSGDTKVIAVLEFSVMWSDIPLKLLYGKPDQIPEDFKRQYGDRKGNWPGIEQNGLKVG